MGVEARAARRGRARTRVALLLVVAALAGADGASTRSLAEPVPAGADWVVDARSLRGKSTTRFEYVCPANGRLDQVWGTDVYTDDSSVCTAAVHAGAIAREAGGIVTIEHLPGQASYTGSTRNGVTSVSWPAYVGSFRVVSAVRGGGVAGVLMGGGSWTATATSFRGQNGTRYRFVCPSGGRPGSVYGTNVYTDDSSVCTAAVHVGLVELASGGRVTIEMRPGQASYASFAHNGITSRPFGRWTGSFAFAGAPPIPGSGGGGGGGGGPPTTTTGTGAAEPPPTAVPTGIVLVNGRPFTGGTIPFGSTVDVTEGTLRLTASSGSLTVNGAAGLPAVFKLLRGTDRKKPVVELRLTRGDFSVCPNRKKSSIAQAPGATVRQLWGSGKGRFRTRGKYASATVSGTRWLTADRCDGTLVRVTQGRLRVVDFPQRAQLEVRAGRSYVARP